MLERNLLKTLFKVLAEQKRILVSILLIISVTSCSSNTGSSSQNPDESKATEVSIQPLTNEELENLRTASNSLNVTYDDFDENYLINSRPSENCPNHTIWIDFKLSADGKDVEPYLQLFTRDDILDKIGSPGGVLIKQGSDTVEYSHPNGEDLDNVYCGANTWGYQSKHYIYLDIEILDFMLNIFTDSSTKFRLLPDEIQSGYRDAKLSQGQRDKNVTALKLIKAAVQGQITPSEILGN